MVSVILWIGIFVAVFVGFNIGGSSTGVAFGPAIGSKVITKLAAAGLMTVFALLGGWTVGRHVIRTMGGDIVPRTYFSPEATVGILFFIGFALLISNLSGVPASTSMTAVGAIAGLGVASGSINWGVMGRIVSWWIVAPILAFWVCAVIGRYFYPYLAHWFAIDQSEGPLVEVRKKGLLPVLTLGENTTYREFVGSVVVIIIGCYMAFSAGASNTANAVAPLVGSEQITMEQGILLAGGAIGLGAFTIARRTLETVGNDLTELPILAALIVEVVSASIITMLSALGIPASLAVSATMCIVGLGWGRATRTVTLSEAVSGGEQPEVSVNALSAEPSEEGVPRMGEEETRDLIESAQLFSPSSTRRVIMLWIFTPSVSAIASYLLFTLFPLYA
ncbi:MAG: anion permease [Halobacteria archaeon]|nr:anion permease [Halobacteria archaeon]